MSFHLVTLADNEFEIISEDKYSTGNILASGEFIVLQRMLQLLKKSPQIKLKRLECDEGISVVAPVASEEYSSNGGFLGEFLVQPDENSPLLEITKTVAVTSSGRTKYVLSDDEEEEDPYACDVSSGDEYVPESNKRNFSSVKKRLFVKDSSSETTDSSSASSVDGCASSSVEPSNYTPQTLAVVCISGLVVTIEVSSPIHAGQYVVKLFPKTLKNGENILQGYIMNKNTENHNCTFPTQGSTAPMFCDTRRTTQHSLICNMDMCCPVGSLFGFEKFIEQPLGKYIAVLTHCNFLNQLPIEIVTTEESSSTENPEVSKNKKKPKLRQHCCYYCREMKTCMGRHLQVMHTEEQEVKQLMNLRGAEKNKALARIRHLGNKAYNQTVHPEKRIVARRHVVQPISNSIHCPNCNALIGRRNFSKHHIRCSKRLPDRRKRIQEIEYQKQEIINDDLNAKILKDLMKDLKNDEVSSVIKNDELIQQVGIHICKSNRTAHHMKNARAQMRRCARLLLIMRTLDESIEEMKDCLVCNKYSTIMHATRILCRESKDIRKFTNLKHPTVALQIGPLISALISRRRRFYLERENLNTTSKEVRALESFEALHRSEFAMEITRDALNTASTNKFINKKELPTAADIQKLSDHCKRVFEETYSWLLNEKFDQDWRSKWTLLGQVLLCQILVFNRRRPGELSRTLLDDYKVKKKVNQEEYESLNRLEIICADFFTMIHIKGKRGKTLSILLQPDNIKGLDLFISLREKAGISDENPYLFSFNNKTGHFSAAEALNLFKLECKADNPETITPTNLRKQAATMCQIFNLSENELKQLADFMGHTFDVHLNHYRMPEKTTQIVNISRFLAVIGDKNVHKMRGKSWDELQFSCSNENNSNQDDDNDDSGSDEEDEGDSDSVDGNKNSLHATSVDLPDTNFLAGPSCSREEAAVAAEEVQSRPKRRRAVPRRYRITTPKKKVQTEEKRVMSSPNSLELLNILNNPANRRKKNSPLPAKQKRVRWSSVEIELMKTHFAKFLNNNKPLPNNALIRTVFEKYREKFHESRTVPSLYAWVQNERRKL